VDYFIRCVTISLGVCDYFTRCVDYFMRWVCCTKVKCDFRLSPQSM
jgi:hypothetical protein